MLLPLLVVLEDVILDFKELDVGEGVREQFNEGLEKIRAARKINMDRLRDVLIACAHGWEVVKDYKENKDNVVSAEKDVMAAVARVKKRKATEKVIESSSKLARSQRGDGRGKGAGSGRGWNSDNNYYYGNRGGWNPNYNNSGGNWKSGNGDWNYGTGGGWNRMFRRSRSWAQLR